MTTLLYYIVCATPRSGSSLLCEALKRSGVGGVPEEYFSEIDEPSWMERLGSKEAPASYFERVVTHASTPNGVCGFKLMWGYFERFVTKLSVLRDDRQLPPPQLVEKTFPNVQYIFITRRDKISQSISFLRALQTGAWTRQREQETHPYENRCHFDTKEIDRLRDEIERHEAFWESYFLDARTMPLRVVYEDLVQDPVGTAIALLDRLGVEAVRSREAFEPGLLLKQADEITSQWLRMYYALNLRRP